jgi:hypothetical protein
MEADMMRKTMFRVLGGICLAGVGLVHAGGMDDMPGMAGTKAAAGPEVTLVGEVVDMDCYMNEGLHGSGHQACAVLCLHNGSPVGLLTDDGKAYFLSADKDKIKAYNLVRTLGGDRVKVTGVMRERGGARCLNVDGASKL